MDCFLIKLTHLFRNFIVFGEFEDGLDILVGKGVYSKLVVAFGYVIGVYDGGKDRETVGRIQRAVVVVMIDAGQFLAKA